MQSLTDIATIITVVLSALTGGGLHWIFFSKLKRRQMKDDIIANEYKSLDAIIQDFIQTNAALAADVAALRRRVEDYGSVFHQLDNYINENCNCEYQNHLKKIMAGIKGG